jgi:hypothetical protein
MYRDESLKGLYFIRHHWLPVKLALAIVIVKAEPIEDRVRRAHIHFHPCPERRRGLVVPCVDDATPDMFA